MEEETIEMMGMEIIETKKNDATNRSFGEGAGIEKEKDTNRRSEHEDKLRYGEKERDGRIK